MLKIKLFCSIFALTLSFAALGQQATGQTPEKYPTYPTIPYNTGPLAEQIKRGEYLAKMGDCIACHTAPGGKAFAGQDPIETPFGTIYTPNITADKETGLGNWTEADFIKAMREGISPHGQYYYPAFPFYFFNITTDQDLKDIWAYLHAIPAVHEENKSTDLMFPFNWRFLQLGWRLMFFNFQKEGPYQNNPNQSADWNRGNYLVNGLAHCGMCHTPAYSLISPKYSLAAPKKKYAFTGALVQGFFAPDITSNLMAHTTPEELGRVFKENRMIGGGSVEGPMKEANADSLKYLTDADVKAIYTYLASVKSETPPKPSSSTSGSGGGSGPGKDIYEKYCTGCHTTGAGGAPKLGDSAVWAPRIKQGMNLLYKNAINGIGGMPPKGTCVSCTDQEIQQAVQYMVDESQGGSGESTTATVKAIPKLSMADGKKIYEKRCASCHAPGTHYLNAPIIGNEKVWDPIIKQGVDIVILHTIHGYGNMPPRGGCTECNDAEIKAAVKYMLQNSQTGKDFSLW